ncbi:MAG TPA: hypothetical protein VMU76_00320 [Acidimicrobiales bacterium]|nr:hypothetical protein [Acidimicrobiales bacterium]
MGVVIVDTERSVRSALSSGNDPGGPPAPAMAIDRVEGREVVGRA